MNSYKHYLLPGSAFVILLGSFALGATQVKGGDPVGPPKPVKVVNAADEPVPVTGTVNVGNLGDSALLVRDLDNPALQPFQQFVRLPAGPGEFTVPQGKRLVIEYFSGSLSSATTCEVNFAIIQTTVNVAGEDRVLNHVFPPTATTGTLSEAFSHQTRIYADPNTVVRVRMETDPNDCGGSLLGAISGYLVDVP